MRRGVRHFAHAFALSSAMACACVDAHARQPASARGDESLQVILARVGEGVVRYHAGLFGLAFEETVTLEELREDMTPKKSREFVFASVVLREDLSKEEGDYYAETVRRLKTVDGRAAKKDDEAERFAVGAYAEALNFLLPREQKLYEFRLAGEETLMGRRALRVGLLRPGEGEPRVEWKGNSFRVVNAPTRWTFWVDAESFDVLRVESHLAEPFEFESPRLFRAFGPKAKFRYARHDYAVTFRRVRLKDPDETRLVPDTVETVGVIEGASRPRLRRTTRFSDYRRFRSDVKVVEEP
ncbi:MAG TPA: hypothetical protein VM914_11755 [Pyrinomonadaceae bacterium]|nr:hypothetical protein [Pyrinomonadaceae bacterium]